MDGFSRRTVSRALALLAFVPALAAAAEGQADQKPVAIKGYDPVAYFTAGRPVPGSAEFEFEWDEQRYRFASAENRDRFKADPVRYAPQFASFCALSLVRGEVAEANPEYWLISEGKLYLFGKAVGPGLFQQELAKNVGKAEANSWLTRKQ